MNDYSYPSFNAHLREHFGCRVQRIGVDGGFTCPNIDGTKSRGGCMFCDASGSLAPYGDSQLSVAEQIQKGTEYYLIMHAEKPSGYFCIHTTEDAVFLSKLYVLVQNRGQGLGKMAMNFIENKTVNLGYKKISLTVNKYNDSSIKAYKKMGFKMIKPWVQDIGNNYIMDDYYLEKDLKTKNG